MKMGKIYKFNQVILEHNSPLISFLKIHFFKFSLRIPEGPCYWVIFFFFLMFQMNSLNNFLIGGHYPKEHVNHNEELQTQNMPFSEEVAINLFPSWRHCLTCQRKKSLLVRKSKSEETDHLNSTELFSLIFFSLHSGHIF